MALYRNFTWGLRGCLCCWAQSGHDYRFALVGLAPRGRDSGLGAAVARVCPSGPRGVRDPRGCTAGGMECALACGRSRIASGRRFGALVGALWRSATRRPGGAGLAGTPQCPFRPGGLAPGAGPGTRAGSGDAARCLAVGLGPAQPIGGADGQQLPGGAGCGLGARPVRTPGRWRAGQRGRCPRRPGEPGAGARVVVGRGRPAIHRPAQPPATPGDRSAQSGNPATDLADHRLARAGRFGHLVGG